MTTLHEELQGNSVTLATSGNPSSPLNARIAAGLVGGGFNVNMDSPAAPGPQSSFNYANAGVVAQGATMVAAGTQPTPAMPVTPEQIAPATPSVASPGLG